ncbi:MAG: c-type cytochrome [Longimicrobiales bacterium]|nr:c-type cytochrome [Longimicrobiales bacterium]
MPRPARRSLRLAACLTLLPMLGVGALLPVAASAQEAPENLQVLPKDMTRQQVNQVMRGFTAGLGVRCSACHVGEEGQPLNTYDFASDDKPMKLKAREMLRMSAAINDTYLAELPERREPNVRVTCITCHRGVTRPQPIESIVQQTMAEDGVDTALERYRQLRERHSGGFAYDFTDRPLVALSDALAEGNADAAVRILELNLEFNPRSALSLFGLARIYDTAGDKDKAIDHFRRGLEIMPDNAQAQRRLKELTGGV